MTLPTVMVDLIMEYGDLLVNIDLYQNILTGWSEALIYCDEESEEWSGTSTNLYNYLKEDIFDFDSDTDSDSSSLEFLNRESETKENDTDSDEESESDDKKFQKVYIKAKTILTLYKDDEKYNDFLEFLKNSSNRFEMQEIIRSNDDDEAFLFLEVLIEALCGRKLTRSEFAQYYSIAQIHLDFQFFKLN